jgi:hypothetical protein
MGRAWSRRCACWGMSRPGKRGSHIRVTTELDGQNHEVIPYHDPIKAGTLICIHKRIAARYRITLKSLGKMLAL